MHVFQYQSAESSTAGLLHASVGATSACKLRNVLACFIFNNLDGQILHGTAIANGKLLQPFQVSGWLNPQNLVDDSLWLILNRDNHLFESFPNLITIFAGVVTDLDSVLRYHLRPLAYARSL
jgi:hypothetical protein